MSPLVLIMPNMSGCVKTFKVEDESSKLMSFHIDDEKLPEKYKAIWTKIEYIKNIKSNALPVYYDIYIKTKIRIYSDKVYINFHGLNGSDDKQSEFSTAIFIDSLLTYEKNITCKYIETLALIKW